MQDKYTVESAVAVITGNGGKVEKGVIRHSSPGLKLLSAIDYLVNNHKFIWLKGDK